MYVSYDVVRYRGLIRFLALAAFVHGTVIFGIGVAEGLPAWWRYGEGPCYALMGAAILTLQKRAEASAERGTRSAE